MAWSIRQMLIEEVAQKEGLRQARIAKKRKLVDTLYQKASGGDMKAMQLILQYHDGMPAQSVDHTTGGERIGTIVYIPTKHEA